MSGDLIKEVQENLGYPSLHKVDLVTGTVITNDGKEPEDCFSQAILPTVLTALHRYSRTDEAAETILFANISLDWAGFIFGDQTNEIIAKISAYSQRTKEDSIMEINAVTREAILVIRESLGENKSIVRVKNILSDSLDETLLYLPPVMEIGKLLHDNTLDDGTHKMEGPISGLMHAIGSAFSGSDSDENMPIK